MTQQLSHFGIGASEISAVCGMNPYASPWDVYLRKTGQAPETEYSEPMEWGHRLEPAIRQKYADETKSLLHVPTESLFHETNKWARATPDGVVIDQFRHSAWLHLLQCKNVGYWVERAWRDAPPEYVQLQEQWEMYVTGLARADIACLIAGNDFRVYTVHRDDRMIADLVSIASAFWKRCERKEPPPIDDSDACKDHFERQLRKAKPVEIVANDEVDELFANWRQLTAEQKRIKARVDEIRNHVRAHMADAEASRIRSTFGTASLVKSAGKTETNWRLVAELLGSREPETFREIVAANTTVTEEKVTLYAPREWAKDKETA